MGLPIMPRDVSLSDSKCWNGGHEWANRWSVAFSIGLLAGEQLSDKVKQKIWNEVSVDYFFNLERRNLPHNHLK